MKNTISLSFFLTICLSLLCSSLYAQSIEEVRLMRQKGRTLEQEEYYIKLLDLALEKTVDTHGRYELVLTDKMYYQRDALINMRRGSASDIDVMYAATSKPRELVFRPIRVPILRGLIGHRIGFVASGKEDILANVRVLDELKDYTFIQGTDWPDTEILEKNGLEVITAQNYDNWFGALENGTADLFPRGATEIEEELNSYTNYNIAVERNVVIYYPTAFYYFTVKENKKLADRIEAGLNEAVKDGSFQQLFDSYFAKSIKDLNLGGRTYIKLDNPLLPKETPLNRDELWLKVGQ